MYASAIVMVPEVGVMPAEIWNAEPVYPDDALTCGFWMVTPLATRLISQIKLLDSSFCPSELALAARYMV